MQRSTALPEHRPSRSCKRLLEDEVISRLMQQFAALFPTEKDCLEELYRIAEEDGFLKCHYCHYAKLERQYGKRTAWCRMCKKTTWITGGTFFHGMRTARPWLLAIWFMQHGVILSSLQFREIAGIAQSSALHIFNKLATVLEVRLRTEEKQCFPSKLFQNVFFKRSKETPAGEHPRTEQTALELKNVKNREDGEERQATETKKIIEEKYPPNNFENKEERLLYECLSSNPVSINALSERTGMGIQELSVALTMLEISGAVERVAGNRYVKYLPKLSRTGSNYADIEIHTDISAESALTEITKIKIDRFMDFIRLHFQGISRKYLQRYLAAYRHSVLFPVAGKVDQLLKSCFEYGRLTTAEIINSVSPLTVNL